MSIVNKCGKSQVVAVCHKSRSFVFSFQITTSPGKSLSESIRKFDSDAVFEYMHWDNHTAVQAAEFLELSKSILKRREVDANRITLHDVDALATSLFIGLLGFLLYFIFKNDTDSKKTWHERLRQSGFAQFMKCLAIWLLILAGIGIYRAFAPSTGAAKLMNARLIDKTIFYHVLSKQNKM